MNLLKTLATVSSMTLLSRILGFVRDFVIARAFGAGMLTDAFFVAFKLPNLLRRLFAEGAFSQAFVPVLGQYRNTRPVEETRQLVDRVASLLLLVVFAVTLLGMAGAPVSCSGLRSGSARPIALVPTLSSARDEPGTQLLPSALRRIPSSPERSKDQSSKAATCSITFRNCTCCARQRWL